MADTAAERIYELVRSSNVHARALLELNAAAQLARTAGASWAQIGDATGMSRQAAWERWGGAPRKGRLTSVQVEELFADL